MATRIRHDIFIASTIGDLRDARETVARAVMGVGEFPILVERFAPSIEPAKAVIENAIATSDVFLLVMGTRGGTYTEAGDQTFTEYEYQCALRYSKPILALLPSEEKFQRDSILAGESQEQKRRVAEFRRMLSVSRHAVAYYADVEDLADRVFQLLPEIIARLAALPPNTDTLELSFGNDATVEFIIVELDALQKIYTTLCELA